MTGERQPARGVVYHEQLAANWSTLYQSRGFSRRREFLVTRMNRLVTSGSRWIDAGCGSGVLTRELIGMGARGVAVDASPAMIASASRESGQGEAFVFKPIETIEAMAEDDASFDGVICSSVVEYLADPGAAVREFSRVLKPGGALLLTVPNAFSAVRTLQRVVRYLAGLVGVDCFAYLAVSRFDCSARGIRRILEEGGFDVVAVEHFDPLLPDMLLPAVPGALLVVTAQKQ